MFFRMACPRKAFFVATQNIVALVFFAALALNHAAFAQQPAPAQLPTPAKQPEAVPPPNTNQAPNPAPAPAPQPAQPQPPADAPQQSPPAPAQAPHPESVKSVGITEDELRQMLVGKPLYLRAGYLDNTLSFSESGSLIGHSAQGSYTLSAIQIDRLHLTKHKLELEGARYGLHFLGALPYEDPAKVLDRVRITPKKKMVKITIDRELVVTPKKKKEKDSFPANNRAATSAPPAPAVSAPTPVAQVASQPSSEPNEPSDADQAKAEIAAAPPEERPADPGSVTTTLSPAHAAKVLKDALDRIFAPGLDDRMMAAMPDFWKLYYQAVAAKSDYRPQDPSVLRQTTVDKKAVLVSQFVPESNEFAQASGVAGMALYHTVIGADGKPQEIAVARPIGFGLDENAVDSIRKATFEPAIKDGKPVPVLLDLVVQFRIYSKRTSVTGQPEEAEKPAATLLPGPYSVNHP
jgi:outer membrane biosynthesis protein TonB